MMKKIIVASLAASVVVTGSAFAMTPTVDVMMKKDDGAMMMKKEEGAMMMKKEVVATSATSQEITELQEVLIEKGYLVMPAGASKGYFGKLTKAGLIKFQKANGLNAAGYFGPLSKAKVAGSRAMMKKEDSVMMKKEDSAMMMKKETTN
jgi:peptidoglycan hydrolase-like protein with peptidoglycan-binding domain